jgi:hypothetical protein
MFPEEFNSLTISFIISEVAVDPRLMWCPRPGCETVCTLTEEVSHKKTKRKFFGLLPISRNQRNQAVVCSSCQFSFCSQCKTPWHIDSPCPSLSRLLSDPNKNVHDPVIIYKRFNWYVLDLTENLIVIAGRSDRIA